MILRPMNEAPKDGTKIIIMWLTPNNDCDDCDIRIAKWWTPTNISQWEQGVRPCWQYISDKHSCMSIKKPIGWAEIPTGAK
jgi:hypothetical protein